MDVLSWIMRPTHVTKRPVGICNIIMLYIISTIYLHILNSSVFCLSFPWLLNLHVLRNIEAQIVKVRSYIGVRPQLKIALVAMLTFC